MIRRLFFGEMKIILNQHINAIDKLKLISCNQFINQYNNERGNNFVQSNLAIKVETNFLCRQTHNFPYTIILRMICPFCQEEVRLGFKFERFNTLYHLEDLCSHGCCVECYSYWIHLQDERRCPYCKVVITGYRRYIDYKYAKSSGEGGYMDPIIITDDS